MNRGDARTLVAFLIVGPLLSVWLVCSAAPTSTKTANPMVGAPTPDPLATPVMPESPTQIEVGRNLYYYQCMPCHGDRGQGLTDEWRQVWEEDHQDCWARGCHAGKAGDEAFPIPRVVPAVNQSSDVTTHFQTAEDLYLYLRHTHPPQRPGVLEDDEYRALTAFLLGESDAPPDAGEGVGRLERSSFRVGVSIAIVAGLLMVALLVLRAGKGALHRHA